MLVSNFGFRASNLLFPLLPDIAEDLPSDVGLTGRLVCQDSPWSGEDGSPQSAHDRRDPVVLDINSPARSAHPFEMDDSLSILIVFEKDLERLPLLITGDDFKIFDESFLLQDPRDLPFYLGGRDIHLLEFRDRPIPNSQEHIGQWIGHRHTPLRSLLPAGFDHPGNLSPGGIFSETEPAHVEFPIITPGPSAERASMVLPNLKFLRPLCLHHQRCLRQLFLPNLGKLQYPSPKWYLEFGASIDS